MIWKTCGATPNGFRSKVSKMQVLQENSIATLEVLRASDMGVFLNGGTGNTNDDILLHKNQQTEEVHIGDKVTVFLYHDPSGRLTASMRLPKIKVARSAMRRSSTRRASAPSSTSVRNEASSCPLPK